MPNYPENEEGQFYMYDKIDMQREWRNGFIAGACLGGGLTMFGVLLLGMYLP